MKTTRSYFERFLSMTDSYQFGGIFTDNILVFGQTGCGKTTFVQNPGKNKMLGNRTSVDWFSMIRSWFVDTSLEFHYRHDFSDFNILIETFRRETFDENDREVLENDQENDRNILGEKRNLIGLSLWMTSQVWWTSQTNLVISWLFQENLATLACIYSTLFIGQSLFGKLYFLTKIFLMFSLLPFN